jgi:hypothetical protein
MLEGNLAYYATRIRCVTGHEDGERRNTGDREMGGKTERAEARETERWEERQRGSVPGRQSLFQEESENRERYTVGEERNREAKRGHRS